MKYLVPESAPRRALLAVVTLTFVMVCVALLSYDGSNNGRNTITKACFEPITLATNSPQQFRITVAGETEVITVVDTATAYVSFNTSITVSTDTESTEIVVSGCAQNEPENILIQASDMDGNIFIIADPNPIELNAGVNRFDLRCGEPFPMSRFVNNEADMLTHIGDLGERNSLSVSDLDAVALWNNGFWELSRENIIVAKFNVSGCNSDLIIEHMPVRQCAWGIPGGSYYDGLVDHKAVCSEWLAESQQIAPRVILPETMQCGEPVSLSVVDRTGEPLEGVFVINMTGEFGGAVLQGTVVTYTPDHAGELDVYAHHVDGTEPLWWTPHTRTTVTCNN